MALSRRTFVGVSATGLGAAVLAALSACDASADTDDSAPSTASSTASNAGSHDASVTVTLSTEAEPAAGFNPLYAWGCGEHVHEPLIQSTLFTTTAELDFVNDLATDYSVSADGLTWTFDIREGVKFTNGDDLTAEDVAFTINGIKANEAAEADLTMVKEAVAESATRCTVTLEKPWNALLYTLATVGIVPKDAYSDDYGEHPIGSGRYMLQQWDRGQQVILVANPDYYGEKPKMDKVVVLFMGEDASLAAARAAQADLCYTASTYASQTPDGYHLFTATSVDSRGISLPCQPEGSPEKEDAGVSYPVGNAVTSDVAVRRAMVYGTNRERLIEAVLDGYGTPAYSCSQGMPWISPYMEVDYSTDKANSLLEEGGWTVGSDGVRAKDGVRASVTLWYSASDSVRQALANEFSNQMKDIGVEVKVQGASFDDIYPHQYTDPVLWGWGSNSPSELYSLHYSSGSGNFSCYSLPSIDDAMDEALAQATVLESYPYWKDAQWNGSEGFAPEGGCSWCWLANVDHLYFSRMGLVIAPQKPHPHGHGWSILNNVDQWSWE